VQADTGMLGGYAAQEYDYDNLYRLVTAKGVYRGAKLHDGYTLQMSYDNLYNITGKTLSDSTPGKSYRHLYQYNPAAPHQLLQTGDDKYKYDANGNLLGTATAENFWDEDNRLMAVIKHGRLSQYTYDAAGDRVIKSSGGIQGVWVNGAPAGAVKHTDNYTMYVSPYLVCRKTGFTKHFYIESQRITSKMGIGSFTNINFPQTGLTAGNVDYSKRAATIEQNRTAYYATLGVSPGPPTDKNFWAKPENSGIQSPVFVDSSVANAVPPGWPGNTTPPPAGPPVFVGAIPVAEEVHAGYGFKGTGHEYEKLQYFFHADHLGSTSYVTDVLGEVNQHEEYIAFGETFIEEHATSASTPYLFNGKEKDAETGLYYYGARYYDPVLSMWLIADPMKDKYPGLSPYNYCLNNPIKLIDPDGKAAVSVHYNITYEAFIEAGYSKESADLVAHYASTYSDHPSTSALAADIAFTLPQNLTTGILYRTDIDYSATEKSQDESNSVWHSMMSNQEAKNGMSEKQATERGIKFGLDNIKESNCGQDIKKLGTGVHALQDAAFHKGSKTDDHLGYNLKSLGKILNDEYGSTKEALDATRGAIQILKEQKCNTTLKPKVEE
jgi:RHS repeat-associated protein